MNIFGNHYLHIILSAIAVYIFLILAVRLFGKKELAQLSVFDLVFILLISNAVQNAMVLGDNSLIGGLLAALALFAVNYLMKYLQFRFPGFGKVLQGEPVMLVYHGKILESHLKLAKITRDEVLEAIREHGVPSEKEVDLAILEVDGNISVLSVQYSKNSSHRRKAHKVLKKES
ncbi:MAG: YetF domain-containing protein [Bacteroidota bacterium]